MREEYILIIAGLEHALNMLNPIEKDLILKRCLKHKTIKQIGNEIGKPVGFVQAVILRGIKKLRKWELRRYYTEGLEASKPREGRGLKNIVLKLGMDENEIKEYVGEYANYDIDELQLSVRSYNGLKRVGINTISQLLASICEGPEEMRRIRNLGKRSIKEILNCIKGLGAEIPCEYKE